MAESYCDWWSLSGVDALVRETPAGWLTSPVANDAVKPRPVANEPETSDGGDIIKAAMPVARVENFQPAKKSPANLPAEWASFQAWLANGDDVPGSQWDAQRVLPDGPVQAPLMVLTAWPEIDDQREGKLLAGPAGALLDAMLAAIGLTRADCYCTGMAVTRPPGGRCDPAELAELDRLVWHHVRLAAPQRLLLVGSDMLRVATAQTLTDVRGKLLDINQDGINMDAVAVAHPAMLLARPAQKAAAWDSLKLLTRGR